MDGVDLIQAITATRYECPVIGVLTVPDMNLAVACLRQGAADVVVRTDLPDTLSEAVVKAGQVLELRQSLFDQAARDRSALDQLSARERDILKAVASGITSKVIAERLGLSVRTVEAHRNTMVAKLQSGTTAGAIAMAVRHEVFQRARAWFGAATGGHLPLSR